MLAVLAYLGAMLFSSEEQIFCTANLRGTFMRSKIAAALSLFLAACGQSPVIEGTVKDNFGHPLADATVQIANSGFTAKTSSSGSYSIDFAPGSLVVNITKEGYTASTTPLNVATATTFPMSEVILTKIPPPSGVFLQGKDDYVPLAPALVDSGNQATAFKNQYFRYRTPATTPAIERLEKELLLLPDDKTITIADSYPKSLRAAFIKADSSIGQTTDSPLERPSGTIAYIEETYQQTENGFDLRTSSILRSVLTGVLNSDRVLTKQQICYFEVMRNITTGQEEPLGRGTQAFCIGGQPYPER